MTAKIEIIRDLALTGGYLDIPPGEVVALNLAINDLGDLGSRQGDFTHRITIPRTRNNRQLLESPESRQVTTIPYTQLTCRLYQGGAIILPLGLLEVVGVGANGYELVIRGGNSNFFNAIGDASLQDLDLSAYDGTWNLTGITGADNATSGLIYALTQYGPQNSETGSTVNARYMMPGMHMMTMVNKIITDAGYTTDGSLFSDSFLSKIFMPVVGREWKRVNDVPDDRNFTVTLTSDQTVTQTGTGSTTATIQFNVENPASALYNSSTYTYTETLGRRIGFRILLSGTQTKSGSGTGDTSWCIAELYKNGSDVIATSAFSTNSWPYNFSMDFGAPQEYDFTAVNNNGSNAQLVITGPGGGQDISAVFIVGTILSVRGGSVYADGDYAITAKTYDAGSGETRVTINLAYSATDFGTATTERPLIAATDTLIARVTVTNFALSGTFNTDTLFESDDCYWTFSANDDIKFGEDYLGEDLVSDITQANIIKTFLHLGAGFIAVDEIAKIVYVRSWSDILANKPHAPNWTSKLDWSITPSIEFQWGSYGQTNYFKYQEDQLSTAGIGDGALTIANTNLPTMSEQIRLPFAASDNTEVLSKQYRVALVPRWTYDGDEGKWEPTENAKPRLLYRIAETDQITFDDGSTTSNSTAWTRGVFIDLNEANNLSFGNSLLTDYYGGLNTALQTAQRVTAYFRLKPTDILDIQDIATQGKGWFTPIFLDASKDGVVLNGYYFVNRINNFSGDGSTEVELIRLA